MGRWKPIVVILFGPVADPDEANDRAHAAMTYYFDHPAEIEAEIQQEVGSSKILNSSLKPQIPGIGKTWSSTFHFKTIRPIKTIRPTFCQPNARRANATSAEEGRQKKIEKPSYRIHTDNASSRDS
ncbi:MAG: hypothetical protein HC805_06310 [Alkalinema sp. RL_2_19]|nr:hypothetical protein [Alkalinema sp. RL_2_19]